MSLWWAFAGVNWKGGRGLFNLFCNFWYSPANDPLRLLFFPHSWAQGQTGVWKQPKDKPSWGTSKVVSGLQRLPTLDPSKVTTMAQACLFPLLSHLWAACTHRHHCRPCPTWTPLPVRKSRVLKKLGGGDCRWESEGTERIKYRSRPTWKSLLLMPPFPKPACNFPLTQNLFVWFFKKRTCEAPAMQKTVVFSSEQFWAHDFTIQK